MSKKIAVLNFNGIRDSNFNGIKSKLLSYDMKTMLNFFKNHFSNLAESFLAKLPDASNKYNLQFLFIYYSNLVILRCFILKVLLKKNILKKYEK